MSFKIEKDLLIKTRPFQHGIDLLILEKTEQLVQMERRNTEIRLFNVNYREVHSDKAGYRKFRIIEAFNQRDK